MESQKLDERIEILLYTRSLELVQIDGGVLDMIIRL